MIQFNLLPDIKKEYIKAKKTKRLIVSSSVLIAAGAIVVTGILFSYVQVAQKGSINDLTEDINKELSSLQSIEDLDKILTIQNQLDKLPELHAQKPHASRLFSYLFQLTPEEIKIQEVDLNFESSRLVLTGSTDSLATANKYVDTLKFATYSYVDEADVEVSGIPFTGVLSDLTRNEESASYSIEMTFDPTIFDNTKEVTLTIPNKVTTRSELGKPSLSGENNLFEDSSGGAE